MIGFLIKKTFFDLWDNMLRIVLVNLGFIVSLTIPVLIPGIIPVPALSIAVAVMGVVWCFVYLAATALSVKALSDYGMFGFADFFRNIKAGLPAGIIMSLIACALFIMARFAIPFYLSMNSIIGLILGGVIFWTLILSLISFQFFFAIRARLDTKSFKIIKKCFIIFFDNAGFSFFSFLYTIATLILSIMLALLLPGPAGMLLFLDEAMRLRLLKYDWLEANPEAVAASKRPVIPWDVLLIEERDKTGTRTFRNFIFPWKD
ncbi:MAG: hypothetical protein FWD36_01625 [Treponema sp.]|nr:hypothetical protein [Treponema sp.]